MELTDFEAPSAMVKRCTGEHKIESFKQITERLEKAANTIERDADKLEKSLKRFKPDTAKLRSDFEKLAKSLLAAASSGEDAVVQMKATADGMRSSTKHFTQELREATQNVSTLQNMYTTLGKAISKSQRSGNPRDEMAAEIAAKAYERACKSAEKSLPALAATNKLAQKNCERSSRASKNNYLNSAITMDRTLDKLAVFVKDEEKEISKARNHLIDAKHHLAWAKNMTK